MKHMVILLLSLTFIPALTGCGSKSVVVLIPDPDGHVGQLTIENEAGRQVLKEANQSVVVSDRTSPPSDIKTLSPGEIEAAFSDVLAAQPQPPTTYNLYFIQGTSELTSESQALLPRIIQAVQKRDSTDIVVAGHTDTIGDPQDNYALSFRRARAISDILVDYGIPSEDITVTSHGEGNPLIKTGDEVAEPRNRRVEVVIK